MDVLKVAWLGRAQLYPAGFKHTSSDPRSQGRPSLLGPNQSLPLRRQYSHRTWPEDAAFPTESSRAYGTTTQSRKERPLRSTVAAGGAGTGDQGSVDIGATLGWLSPGRTGTHRWGGQESIPARVPPKVSGVAQTVAMHTPLLREMPPPIPSLPREGTQEAWGL